MRESSLFRSNAKRARSTRRKTRRLVYQKLDGRRMLAVTAVGDFDGDGYDDMVIGRPSEDIGSVRDAGSINVIYGSSEGLDVDAGSSSRQDHSIHRNTSGVKGSARADDLFGTSLAAGDFNGDGYDDLAIGAPGDEDGAVNVLYGSRTGLRTDGDRSVGRPNDLLLRYNDWAPSDGWSYLGAGALFSYTKFGFSLTVGNFQGDVREIDGVQRPLEDLVVGIPGANFVQVFSGTASGLQSTPDKTLRRETDVLSGPSEYGFALAAGNLTGHFNEVTGQPVDDLVVGDPFSAGRVFLYTGIAETGIHANAANVIRQNVLGGDLGGWTTDDRLGDRFGHALAVGDFDDDGFGDIAVGVPGEDIGSATDAGLVNIVYGSEMVAMPGMLPARYDVWHQNSHHVTGGSESYDWFGASLAVGNFDGWGPDDLAIGIPGEAISSNRINDAGAVQLMYGSAVGLQAGLYGLDDQILTQNTHGTDGGAFAGDQFGATLAGGDFNGDGRTDLAVGVPGADVNGVRNVGVASVFYASNYTAFPIQTGSTGLDHQRWSQAADRAFGALEIDDGNLRWLDLNNRNFYQGRGSKYVRNHANWVADGVNEFLDGMKDRWNDFWS